MPSQVVSTNDSYPEFNYNAGAKWIKHLTRERLSNFYGGHYSDFNISATLFLHRMGDEEHVKLKVWSAPGLSKPTFAEAMKNQFKDSKKGELFGPSWTNHWWKVLVTIPADWQHYERVQFEFDPSCEAMIYSVDGTPLQGITGGFSFDRRVEYIIPIEARKDGRYEFVIESTCNERFGNGDNLIGPPNMEKYFRLASADLVVPNMEAWRLLWDFTTLSQLIDSVPGNTILQNRALVAANGIMNAFGKGTASDIKAARKVAEDIFGEGWEAKGSSIYEEGPRKAQIWGIGHCHIDTAWLWPYGATQQKIARSWSTQVDLMDRYPEHRFACSSAQQFKWLEELYPLLFARVKAKVLSGQFQPVGGAWVEHDCNMPSGEAMIRQFLFGQQYFESRFGKRCETAWLPDSFGLTGALPQLIRGSGIKYFFTQKLSWNNINVFPHSTFNWVGIDGTQVLCHMTPVDTYAAQVSVDEVRRGMTNHKNLESSDTALLVFGNGDGGGGPLAHMLENLRRLKAVSNTHRELPVLSMGRSVDEFFEDVENHSNHGATLPNWHGELYLEFHRGTYTSHGSIKKGNRCSEILLRDLELIATLASIYRSHKPDYVYPKQRIDNMWEKVLLNQFHDVLPGSAIGMVYEDAEKLYAEVKKDGEELQEDALSVLFPSSMAAEHSNILGTIIAFNPTFFPRVEVVHVPFSGQLLQGTPATPPQPSAVFQNMEDKDAGLVLMRANGDTPCAVPCANMPQCLPPFAVTQGSDHFILGNSHVQLTVSQGRITSLYDFRQGRELIAEGKTGGIVVFEDRPGFWDAWDVEIHHLETPKRLVFSEVKIVAQGPLRASVQVQVKYDKSSMNVTISLDAVPATDRENSGYLFRFDAIVDWHQRHEILKFEIPLRILNKVCTYETQFGHMQRSTTKNTTWDTAQFEVCGHKYADLSEFGYGVALLSESKYGFSCQGNTLTMSLLRAATAPDPEQDQGKHQFSWGVLPHQGHFLESDVPVAAYLFNSPMHVRRIASEFLPASFKAPFKLEGDRNVFLETVKRGEKDDFSKDSCSKAREMTVVLRLYEAYGGHAHVRLKIAKQLDVSRAFLTNLLEDEGDRLDLQRADNSEEAGTILKLDFRGFEVKTVKLLIGARSVSETEWICVDLPEDE